MKQELADDFFSETELVFVSDFVIIQILFYLFLINFLCKLDIIGKTWVNSSVKNDTSTKVFKPKRFTTRMRVMSWKSACKNRST